MKNFTSRHPGVLALLGGLSLVNAACSSEQTGTGSSGGSSNSGGSSRNSSSASGVQGGSSSKSGVSSGGGSSSASSNGSSGGGGAVSSAGSSATSSAGKGGGGGDSSSGSSSKAGSSGGRSSVASSSSGGTTGSSAGSGGKSSDSSGGSAGKGGTTGSSGGSTGSSAASASCTFDINTVTASAIATVGVVTWGTSLSNPTSARIDFGLDTNYGMSAPVNKPSASGNKTLLLGMKQKKTYHYRIAATNSSGECTSEDKTITTGALATGLPTIKVSNKGDAKSLFGGFLITAQFQSSSAGKAPALIYDGDGDIVWAYSVNTVSDGLSCARMTYDGTHMWINTVNVGAAMMGGGGGGMGTAVVHRVAMDGTDAQDLSNKFTGLNHQLTVLPDETVAFYAYNSNGCDDIKEYSPSGTTKTIVNAGTAQGGSSACHLNNIQYASDDTLLFSDLDSQVVVKVRRKDGSTVWTLNGGKSPLSGVSWKGSQHGLYVMDPDQILVFNNNSTALMGGFGAPGGAGSAGGTGDGSKVLQIKIDSTAKSANTVWSYKGPSNLQTDIMGDIQRLPNGNTIIAYSTKGAVQEVDKDGKVLTDWTFPLGAQFGYIEKRKTLYGQPPR